jgi:hypothetical protein
MRTALKLTSAPILAARGVEPRACGDHLGAALSGDELSRPGIGSFLTRYRVPSTRINAAASRVPRLERLGLKKSLGIVGGGGNCARRQTAERTAIRCSRRLHYLSTNWEVLGGVARTIADWIGGGKRRCDNDL